jgi:hypothetical protein
MNKLHWAKFFWADWSNDSALNLCSLPARGLWMALLCLAAQGEPYGHVTIKGRVPTDDELFDLICPRRTRRREFNLWMAELETHGVLQRDHKGAIVSPRMSQDGVTSLARTEAAHASWKTPVSRPQTNQLPTTNQPQTNHKGVSSSHRNVGDTLTGKNADNSRNPRNLHVQKNGRGEDLHVQTEILHVLEAEAEAEADVGGLPLQPPKV